MKQEIRQRILDALNSQRPLNTDSLERYLDRYGHTIDWPEDREQDYALFAAIATLFSGLDCEDKTFELIFRAIRNIEYPFPHSPAFMEHTFREPTRGANGVEMCTCYILMSGRVDSVAAKSRSKTRTPTRP